MPQDTLYEFDWDPAKALSNQRKHGVTFEEASTVFLDALALTVYDMTCRDEERWFTLGCGATRQAAGGCAHLPGDSSRAGSGTHHLSPRGNKARATRL